MAVKKCTPEMYEERRKKILGSIEQKEKAIASEQQKIAKLKEDLTKNDEEYILSLYRTSGQSASEFVKNIGIAHHNITEKEDDVISIPVKTSADNDTAGNSTLPHDNNLHNFGNYNSNTQHTNINTSKEDNRT